MPHEQAAAGPNGVPTSQGKARGKVILLGEHAVVYGVPAIAVSLERGASASLRGAASDRILLGGEAPGPDNPILAALAAARNAVQVSPVDLHLTLDLPAGSGLGASAALGGATARALASLRGLAEDDVVVTQATDAWEAVFHGTASGVDRAAALGSGALRFVRGQPPEPVVLRKPLHLVVAIAGPPASTKLMVESVGCLRQTNGAQFEKNLAAVEALVDNAVVCLRSGDEASLGKLMDLCQMILSGWMLSTESIEWACKTARAAGALGAKLTGAGGGGAIVALSPSDAMSRPIAEALRREGFEAFSTRVERAPSLCHDHDHP